MRNVEKSLRMNLLSFLDKGAQGKPTCLPLHFPFVQTDACQKHLKNSPHK